MATNDDKEIMKKIADVSSEKSWNNIFKQVNKPKGFQETDVWIPEDYKFQQEMDDVKKQMLDKIKWEWEQQKYEQDPVNKLRREFRKDIDDIKDALRKLGVLLGGDAPSAEMMEKHKALKEAYLKYKMIEKLVLGGEGKGNEGGKSA